MQATAQPEAAVGSVRAQQAPAGPQALRQPARRDAAMAIQMAHATSTPAARKAPASGWCLDQIVASDPRRQGHLFEPMEDKVYRHPTFYALPADVDHM